MRTRTSILLHVFPLILFALCALLPSACAALDAGPRFEIEGGAQWTRLSNDDPVYRDFDLQDRIGYRIGAGVSAPLSSSLSLRSGIFVESKGRKLRYKDSEGSFELTTRLHDVGVPVLLSFTMPGTNVRPFIEAGAQGAFISRVRLRGVLEGDGERLARTVTQTAHYKEAELGLRAAAGIQLVSPLPVRLAASGYLGLTTMDKSRGKEKSRSVALTLATPVPAFLSTGESRTGHKGAAADSRESGALRWGPVLGANIVSNRYLDYRYLFLGENVFRSRVVGRGGVLVEKVLGGAAYARSGLLLDVKGSKVEIPAHESDPIKLTTLEAEYYMTIPLLLGIKASGPGIQPNLHAGPFISYLLLVRTTEKGKGPGVDYSETDRYGKQYRPDIDAGVVLGGGIGFFAGRPLHLDVEYEAGLYNLNDSGNRDDHSFHSRVVALSLGTWL